MDLRTLLIASQAAAFHMDRTSLGCLAGLVLFIVGGVLHQYVAVRAKGWTGYFALQGDVRRAYRKLVADGQAPAWPLMATYSFAAIGIAIMFGSILLSP
ncbi:hypothetical protein SAMN05421770_107177 [Granulicella rosea]|uniref:Uncharacterized protein n=1 Tax=Granulicella rosea TaxID=474952 RepID=A0A239LQQ5_9BACT|nr:hypothetical protein [Granulicella rosea]SNT32232.1 hypothetical protein SAMN05421770_107177 [Granulicella rosea]